MSLRSDLEAITRGMPPGSSVTLPTDWLRGRLEEEGGEVSPPDSLLTLEQIADRVGRAGSTVRTWCNLGHFEGAFRLNGRDWRVPESALRRYLEGQTETGEAPGRAGVGREADLGSWRRVRRGSG
jgi:hypothetical protein